MDTDTVLFVFVFGGLVVGVAIAIVVEVFKMIFDRPETDAQRRAANRRAHEEMGLPPYEGYEEKRKDDARLTVPKPLAPSLPRPPLSPFEELQKRKDDAKWMEEACRQRERREG